MLEQVVAEVATLRSAVALLLAASVPPDTLSTYRHELPSPGELPEIAGKVLSKFSRDLDHAAAVVASGLDE